MPLICLTGTEIAATQDLQKLRKAAGLYYDTVLRTQTCNNAFIKPISFTNKGKKKFLWSSATVEKLCLLPSVPIIISKGTYLGSTTISKNRGDEALAFHGFLGTIELQERMIEVFVNVYEDSNGCKFYNLNKNDETKGSIVHYDERLSLVSKEIIL